MCVCVCVCVCVLLSVEHMLWMHMEASTHTMSHVYVTHLPMDVPQSKASDRPAVHKPTSPRSSPQRSALLVSKNQDLAYKHNKAFKHNLIVRIYFTDKLCISNQTSHKNNYNNLYYTGAIIIIMYFTGIIIIIMYLIMYFMGTIIL